MAPYYTPQPGGSALTISKMKASCQERMCDVEPLHTKCASNHRHKINWEPENAFMSGRFFSLPSGCSSASDQSRSRCRTKTVSLFSGAEQQQWMIPQTHYAVWRQSERFHGGKWLIGGGSFSYSEGWQVTFIHLYSNIHCRQSGKPDITFSFLLPSVFNFSLIFNQVKRSSFCWWTGETCWNICCWMYLWVMIWSFTEDRSDKPCFQLIVDPVAD